MSSAYQTTSIYKPSEAKIRRVQTPPQNVGASGGIINAGGGTAAGGIGFTITSAPTSTALATTLQLQQQQRQQQHQQMQQHHSLHQDFVIKPDSHGK